MMDGRIDTGKKSDWQNVTTNIMDVTAEMAASNVVRQKLYITRC